MSKVRRNKILIINVNWIGDVLFTTPFIRAVSEAYPDSYIACLLHPRCKEMLEDNPCLNEIIIYDEEGIHKSILGKIKLIWSLKKKKFDTAFILHRSFTKALIARLAGVKELVGYPTKKRSFLLTKVVEEPDEEVHKVEYFLNIARAVGIKPGSDSYEFFTRRLDMEYAQDLMENNGIGKDGKLVVICPGGNWNPKRWPKENFAACADLLVKNLGVKILISGSPKDALLVNEIKGLMKTTPIILCGKTSLKQLAAIFKKASLVIANDTGTMHLAVAMKARTIALFGPTSPKLTGPYGASLYSVIYKNTNCDVPCYDFSCRDNSCMKEITVEDVAKEAERMLAV